MTKHVVVAGSGGDVSSAGEKLTEKETGMSVVGIESLYTVAVNVAREPAVAQTTFSALDVKLTLTTGVGAGAGVAVGAGVAGGVVGVGVGTTLSTHSQIVALTSPERAVTVVHPSNDFGKVTVASADPFEDVPVVGETEPCVVLQ